MPEVIFPIVILIVFAVLGIGGTVLLFRALVGRVTKPGRRGIGASLAAALVTAVLVFVLTYLAAWVAMRQLIAVGHGYGVRRSVAFDSDSEEGARIEPTLYQFLFEAANGGPLLCVACIACFCAGLVCFLASGPPAEGKTGLGRLLWSVAWTTAVALGISLFLVLWYSLGEYH